MADMSSDQAFRAIEKVAATSSKNEKDELVRKFLQFETFKRVCVVAYDPFITFGMEKVPERPADAVGATQFIGPVWDMLESLRDRSLTGNAAREEVLKWMQLLTPESAELLKRIIKKDLRAGFSEGTLNRVAKGLIPDTPYMRCSLTKDVKLHTWPWEQGVPVQEKADGMFVNVNLEATGVLTITTRQGNPLPHEGLGDLVPAIKAILKPGTQTHGELLVVEAGAVLPREQGNGILNSIAQGGKLEEGLQELALHVWDQIPLSAVQTKGKYNVAYRERFSGLVRQVLAGQKINGGPSPVAIIKTKIVKSLAEAMAFYAERLGEKKEGAILCHPEGIWKDGTSKEKVKLKLEVDVDLRAKAFVPGTGKNAATFGSIRFESECGQLVVDVSGFTDKRRAELHALGEAVLGQVGTVKANSIMVPSEEGKPHSLFLPRIVEFPRTDKTAADDLARVKAQFESAIRG